MNRWKLGAGLLCGIAAGAALTLQPGAPASAQATVAWASDYNQAAEAARKAGKPLFVAFRCER